MGYTKQTWSNGSGGGTPLSATRLNYIESGIEAVGIVADAAAAGLPGGWVSVATYGATGDGTTDDTSAINAAITAAGVGGTVYFPSHTWGGGTSGASYRVSSTLKPLRSQRWIGTHVPQYDSDEYFLSRCVIRALSSFTGSSLLAFDSAINNVDVTIENLGLQGRGESHATAMDGINGGTTSSSTERNWTIRDCNLSGFSRSAVGGHWLALEVAGSFLMRCDYGINPGSASAALRDVNVHHCKIAWNKSGGVWVDSTAGSGGNTFLNNRVERNGVTPATNALTNRNTNAPGFRFGNVHDTILIGNYTDGNSGPGLHYEDAAGFNYGNTVTANCFIRDGGGDLSTTTLPGVLLKNSSQVHFVGNIIEDGDPSDGGGAGTWPVYGLWVEGLTKSTIADGRIEVVNDADSLHIVGTSNSQTRIDSHQFGYDGLVRKAATVTGSRSIAMTDFGRRLEVGAAYTLTVPQVDTANWAPVEGWTCDILATSASDVTIAAGSGATVNSKSGYLKLDGQWAAATLIYRGSNTWVLVGALKA